MCLVHQVLPTARGVPGSTGAVLLPWVGVFLYPSIAYHGSSFPAQAFRIRDFAIYTALSAFPFACGNSGLNYFDVNWSPLSVTHLVRLPSLKKCSEVTSAAPLTWQAGEEKCFRRSTTEKEFSCTCWTSHRCAQPAEKSTFYRMLKAVRVAMVTAVDNTQTSCFRPFWFFFTLLYRS